MRRIVVYITFKYITKVAISAVIIHLSVVFFTIQGERDVEKEEWVAEGKYRLQLSGLCVHLFCSEHVTLCYADSYLFVMCTYIL